MPLQFFREGKEPGLIGKESVSVLPKREMFNKIFGVVESLAPNFQVIITEHANLEDGPISLISEKIGEAAKL